MLRINLILKKNICKITGFVLIAVLSMLIFSK